VVGAAVWTQFRHQHSLATPPVSDSMQTQKVTEGSELPVLTVESGRAAR
jgi:hypothetical protein